MDLTDGTVDPTAGAMLLPQLQMAYARDPRAMLIRSMMEQGQQSLQQPTLSPFSALAKALTIGLGGVESAKLQSDYANMNKGAMQTLQGALQGSPSALISTLAGNPVLAPMAAQAQLTAAMKAAEPYTLKPGETRIINGQIVGQSGAPLTDLGKLIAARDALPQNDPTRALYDAQIGKLNQEGGVQFGPTGAAAVPGYGQAKGAIAGQTAAGETPALVERAGQTAKAEVPYKTVEVRPGGAVVPLNSVLGTQPAPSPSPQPSAQPAPAPTPASAAQPSAPAAPGAPPAKPSSSTPPASLPDGLRQLPGGGIQVPNPSIVEPLIKADTEEVAKDREKSIAGQADQANVRMIQDFLPKVQTGWSAETKLEGARILKAMGVPDQNIADLLNTNVASGQILQKKFLELSAAAARTLGAREPGSVIQMFSKAYPSIGTDPQAINLQTNAIYMDRQRANDLANAKTNFLNESVNDYQGSGKYRGLQGFNEQFNQTHPAEYYLHAAEAMSGVPQPWQKITDPAQQQAVIDLIPSGTTFLAPDGRRLVKP